MTERRNGWAKAVLSAACVATTLQAAAQDAANEGGTIRESPQAAASPAAPSLNPLSGSLSADSLTGFRDRPLFTPSRRAPQPPTAVEAESDPEPEAATAPPPAPQPNLRLAGVIEGPEEAVAVVEDLGSNTVSQLRLGDMLDGWLVTAIEAGTLRLTLGEQEGEYRLFDPSKAAPPKLYPDE